MHGLEVKFVDGWDDRGDLFTFVGGTAPGAMIAVYVRSDEKTAEKAFGADVHGPDSATELFAWDASNDEPEFKRYRPLTRVSCATGD